MSADMTPSELLLLAVLVCGRESVQRDPSAAVEQALRARKAALEALEKDRNAEHDALLAAAIAADRVFKNFNDPELHAALGEAKLRQDESPAVTGRRLHDRYKAYCKRAGLDYQKQSAPISWEDARRRCGGNNLRLPTDDPNSPESKALAVERTENLKFIESRTVSTKKRTRRP